MKSNIKETTEAEILGAEIRAYKAAYHVYEDLYNDTEAERYEVARDFLWKRVQELTAQLADRIDATDVNVKESGIRYWVNWKQVTADGSIIRYKVTDTEWYEIITFHADFNVELMKDFVNLYCVQSDGSGYVREFLAAGDLSRCLEYANKDYMKTYGYSRKAINIE